MSSNLPTPEFRWANLSDTTAAWDAKNPVFMSGEIVYDETVKKIKIGDGVSTWSQLPYEAGTVDHGALQGLADDDHPQYFNQARGDVRYYTQTQVDNLLNQKYDASNPNNYETPAQLNNRDAANRDRANHTGTQTASTISDFLAAVQAAETTTNLQIIGNTLRYTNEDGVNQDIDLSVYIDDTNLSRLVSGTLNGTTGIATFQRDDSSTFDVDFSPFLSGVTDHGNLSGLGDDDHPQYFNIARGDARYYTQGQIDTQQNAQNTNIGNNASNISSNTSNITSNANAITAEQTARANGDSNLQTQVTANNNAISAETTNRQNADTNLQNQVNSIQSDQAAQNGLIAANTAKVSADGPVSTHSDVNLAGGNSGEVLTLESGIVVPKPITNGFTIFPIWAEENGGIGSGQYEWSFGNGATGNDIGIPVAFDCTLFAATFNADVFGTSVSVNIYRRRNGVNTLVWTPLFNNNNEVVNQANPIEFLAGDTVVFQTNTANGSTTDARIVAWFRQVATNDFAKTTFDQAAGSGINFTSTTFADVPGLTTTVTLTKPGSVWGEATYSAARSGAANSVAQFRVVINADNGSDFPDTLSTFFDNGVADHFLQNQPAGTYTIKLQAQVSQPINIGAVAIKATATED